MPCPRNPHAPLGPRIPILQPFFLSDGSSLCLKNNLELSSVVKDQVSVIGGQLLERSGEQFPHLKPPFQSERANENRISLACGAAEGCPMRAAGQLSPCTSPLPLNPPVPCRTADGPGANVNVNITVGRALTSGCPRPPAYSNTAPASRTLPRTEDAPPP
jgi:hypothetical protein